MCPSQPASEPPITMATTGAPHSRRFHLSRPAASSTARASFCQPGRSRLCPSCTRLGIGRRRVGPGFPERPRPARSERWTARVPRQEGPRNRTDSPCRLKDMKPARWALLALASPTVFVASGCSSAQTGSPAAASASTTTGGCREFTLSVAIDRDGQASPLAAAIWFANGHSGLDGWDLPRTGWTLEAATRTVVKSGATTLDVRRLSDETWAVISGSQCQSA